MKDCIRYSRVLIILIYCNLITVQQDVNALSIFEWVTISSCFILTADQSCLRRELEHQSGRITTLERNTNFLRERQRDLSAQSATERTTNNRLSQMLSHLLCFNRSNQVTPPRSDISECGSETSERITLSFTPEHTPQQLIALYRPEAVAMPPNESSVATHDQADLSDASSS